MDEIKYKVLREYEDWEVGTVVGIETLAQFTEEEVDELVADGILELVETVPPAPEPEPTPAPEPEAPKKEKILEDGDPAVKAKYRVTGVIAIMDGSRQKQGEYNVGSIYEFSEDIGNMYVNEGLAERLEDEE